MLLAGDEFGRTQQGNNNAYCQDDEISWLDWDINDQGRSLIGFVRLLTELRLKYPVLRRGRFANGELDKTSGVKDVTWINAAGTEMQADHWADTRMHCFGMLLDGRAQATGIRRPGEDASLLMVLNAHDDVVDFVLPQVAGGGEWKLLVDTNLADDAEKAAFRPTEDYEVTGRSLLLFALAPPAGR